MSNGFSNARRVEEPSGICQKSRIILYSTDTKMGVERMEPERISPNNIQATIA